MNTSFATILLVLLIFMGCSKDKIEGNIQTNAALADSLRLSPFAAEINNDSLFLTANVWRDFMPENTKQGSGLYCSIQLACKDSLAIPAGLILTTQYVINGDQIWINQHPEVNNQDPYTLQAVLRNGPKWGPDIFVDVVCEFKFNNRLYTIIANQRKIEATH